MVAALAIVAAACPARASVGFYAALETPPSPVSPFVEDYAQFSVALQPKSKVLLDNRLTRTPKVVQSVFESRSLRLNVNFYSHGRIEKDMIPVSVDAVSFMNRRVDNFIKRSFSENMYLLLQDSERKESRGLGISVALPKRLNKIFGEGGAGLKVAGYRKITFAGRSQWTDQAESETFRQNKFPSLRMEQISRFDITGTIGSKISVKVSQDSQTDIPLANRIQIRYKGDDDDILKSIEAGNTTLSLPNTQFVGYSSRIRGLFGVKAEAQIGRLYLTGIASQEKGSSEKASFTATGEENADFVRDYEYLQRIIFDLGKPEEFNASDSVTKLFVYESISGAVPDLEAVEANLWVDPDNQEAYPNEDIKADGQVKVNLLPDGSYEFINDPGRNLHYVRFTHPRDKTKHLACWMEIKRADGTYDTVGSTASIPYDLKLLAIASGKNPNPDQETWHLMWRNCYSIPPNVDISDIRVKIFKGPPGTETNSDNLDYQSSGNRTAPYIEILGLDQYNESEMKDPDGLLDDLQEVFRPDWGLLIFPNRRPFDSDQTFTDKNDIETPPLAVRLPEIYDFTSLGVPAQSSQYYLQLTTTARSSKIKLDRANILEGSETITVNGRQLARGTDYTINYEFGQITLLDDEATDPNASLSIDYEYAPFFAVQKKTLLGARAEYDWSDDFQFGSTFLYKSDKTQERKPKVGQETAKTIVLDGDMSLKLHPNFLTTIVDAVPFVEAESPSNISIIAEVAQSRPNPNVDGIAYVDDFESALEQLSLGTSRTRWKHASTPVPIQDIGFQRTKMLWHTPRELVQVQEVYDRESAQGEGTLRTLRMIFRPDSSGADSWAGVTRYFGSAIDSKRAQLFEVRLRAYDDIQARLHFDFGIINENLDYELGHLESAFTEDSDLNGAVSELEDIGLDGVADGAGETPTPWGTSYDLAGDNWYFQGDGKCPFGPDQCNNIDWDSDEWYYEFLNGTEGNIRDPSVAGLPDREILSTGISGLETSNAYFSYVLDLSSDEFLVPNSEKNGWVTYRIPIRDSSAIDQVITSGRTPDWNNITHVRVWFESQPGQTEHDTVEIADWYFVQSNWQDSVILGPDSANSNTKFVVAEMSDDENQDFTPPPGVEAYRDPTTNVTEAQRALLMQFSNLRAADSCLATKDLITVDRYSGYRRMEMFVYGAYDNAADEGKIRFFFRLGQDARNYYEYYTTVYEGWDERNFVNVDFNEITGLKDDAQKAIVSGGNDVNFDDGEHYRIFGNPDINKVRYFAAGLINTDTTQGTEVSGQVWLDELRVTEVRRDIGTAGRIQVAGNLADLLSYNFSFESRDPYFRGLSSSTRGGSTDNLGSGQTNTTYNYGVTFNINKFLPRSWGAQIPISMRYSKATQTPLLRNNSDVVLPEETRREEQTIRESKNINVSSRFNRKGRNPLFSLLLNRLKTSVSYGRTDTRSVTAPYNFGESYAVRSSFDFSVANPPYVPIFSWTRSIPILKRLSESRLGLYPEKWTTSGNFNRSLTITDDINFNRRSSNKRTFDGKMDMKYRLFHNLSITLSYQTNRDLSDPDLVNLSFKNPKLGLETHYGQSISTSYDPKLLGFFKTAFSYKANYSDDWQRQYRARRSAMSRSVGVSGDFDHQKLLGEMRKKKNQGRSSGDDRRRRADDEAGLPFYQHGLNALRLLTGWIDPFTYSYSESFNNSLPGMDVRPGWRYRFGFKDEADVGEVSEAVGSQASSEGVRYDVGSGFKFLGGLITTVRFGRSVNRDLVKQGARYENISTNWPDLALRIQKFKTFPLIKKYLNGFIDVFAPRTGFKRQTKETRDIDGDFLVSSSVTRNHKPLLSISFKAIRMLSLSAAYSLEKAEKEVYNSASGDLQSETVSTKKTVAVTAKYSFSSPRGISLPIFGRLKFDSRVELEMSVRINSQISETAQSGQSFATSTDKSDYMYSPVISYAFSRQIKGGLTLRWQDSNDNYRSRKSHTREVQIWTEISF